MTERDLDAPTQPGGPQRTDAPDGHRVPGTPAQDPGPEVERVTKPKGDGQAPTPSGEGEEQSDAARERQEQNAESSLDQPSS